MPQEWPPPVYDRIRYMKFKDKWLPEVRAYMRFFAMTQKDLALHLDTGKNRVCDCLTGKKAFTTEECYVIMNMFDIPYERMHEVFPPLPAKQAKARKVG